LTNFQNFFSIFSLPRGVYYISRRARKARRFCCDNFDGRFCC